MNGAMDDLRTFLFENATDGMGVAFFALVFGFAVLYYLIFVI